MPVWMRLAPVTGFRSLMSSKTKKPPSFPRRLTALTTFGCHLGRILLRETTLPVRQVGAGVSPTLDAGFKVLLPTEMSRSRCVVSTRQCNQTGKSRQTSSGSEEVFDHMAQRRPKYRAQTLSASCHAGRPKPPTADMIRIKHLLILGLCHTSQSACIILGRTGRWDDMSSRRKSSGFRGSRGLWQPPKGQTNPHALRQSLQLLRRF